MFTNDSYLTIIKDGTDTILTIRHEEENGNLKVYEGETLVSKLPFDEKIIVPEGVTVIEKVSETYHANGRNITSIEIPSSTVKIEPSAFLYCYNLEHISVSSDNKQFDSRNHSNAIIDTARNTLVVGCKNTKIPSSIVEIGEYAFRDCPGLTNIVIPSSVTKIGFEAFGKCTRLTNIVIPSSVTEIKGCAFDGCSFKKLLFEGNLPEDKDCYSIFSNCKIEELWVNTPRKKTVIPNGLQNAIEQSDGRVIYAIPALCEEDSKIPGYIRATLVNNDELIDINTKYILSVEPYELKDKYEKYQPHTGTLMTCASNGIERRCQILVYEPHEMVVHKIAKSLTMLSQQVGGIAGLLNQIDTLFKYKMK